MAMCDYRQCDVCGGKAFYDANLSYEFSEKINGVWVEPEDQFRIAGEDQSTGGGCSLGYVGDWAVICTECAKTHRTIIVPIDVKDQ